MPYTLAGPGFRFAHEITDAPDARAFAQHAHIEYELLYFLHGDADCVLEHRRRTLRPGELIIIPPMVYHFISPNSAATYERTVLDFTVCAAPKPLLDAVFAAPRVIDTGGVPEIPALLARMDAYAERFPAATSSVLLTGLTAELVCLLSESGAQSDRPLDGFNRTVEEALRYIDAHIADVSGLDELCAHLYISRAYLQRVFSAALGISPMRYITSRRLWLAESRLRLGEKPSQAALACGFRDYSAFYRAYRAFFGISPSETRPNTAAEPTKTP